eukprot:Em0011g523a
MSDQEFVQRKRTRKPTVKATESLEEATLDQNRAVILKCSQTGEILVSKIRDLYREDMHPVMDLTKGAELLYEVQFVSFQDVISKSAPNPRLDEICEAQKTMTDKYGPAPTQSASSNSGAGDSSHAPTNEEESSMYMGSGKTLAYTLPLCALLTLFPPVQPGEGPKALILVPTRELAKQIYEYVLQFVSKVVPNMPVLGSSQYKTLLVCGGVPVSRDVEAGADVVIATPGKLMQLQEEHRICLDRISYLVVDEVDRFMHGNMEEQLRKIFAIVTSTLRPRQTLLFSATLPENLERLARSAVLDPVQIHVGAIGVTATNIEQHVIFMHSYQKHKKLLEVLRATPAPPVVVFCNTVQTVDEIVNLLRSEQFHVAGLHSEKNQDVRFKTIDCMKKGSVDVLVATDVASRGLDMRDVDHVINYDLPDTIEDYVHRCGRTGRLRSAGKATSFLTLECKIAAQLKDLLQSLDQPIPPELESTQRFGGRIVRTDLGDRVIN